MKAATTFHCIPHTLVSAAIATAAIASGCTCNGATSSPGVVQPGASATGTDASSGGPGEPAAPPGAATGAATDHGPNAPAAPPGVDPLALACRRRARDVQGDAGESMYVTCPAGCLAHASHVWGTDLYTDDSAVCPALIHAGALGPTGGVARVTFVAGQLAYPQSKRNGVQSSSYTKWRRSFYGQAINAQGEPTQPAPEVLDEHTARFDCTMRATRLPGDPGTSFRIFCPGGCPQGSLYGTGIYTHDSAVCRAGTHAGVIGPDGGALTLTIRPGQPSYKSSERHGVKSRSYGTYSRSFEISAAR